MSRISCSGPANRREFLRAGALALGGLTLPQLAAAAASQGRAANTSVILFWMWGGPSQLETFDCKPDAPSEYRGPFRPIPTKVPGLDVCEIFPKLAGIADKYSIIRSIHHDMSSHNDGSIEMLTGKTPAQADPTSTAVSAHPDIGMVTSRMRGSGPGGIPNYVGIPKKPFMTRPQYLGPAMQYRALHMDPALSTLIEDIHARDQQRNILVVAMGEFGRTPRLSHASGLEGRDHWPNAMSVLVSGGGWRMGQVIGATNSKAEYPTEKPYTPQDLLATIYHHLGINPKHEFLDHAGRPQRILYHGQAISELL
jgi:hypothetical protein